MKVDDLPAGPRLDALVAEKVMGWEQKVIRWNWVDLGKEEAHIDGVCDGVCWTRPDGIPIPEAGLPPYSTDIKAAMEAISKLNEQGWNSVLIGPRHLKGPNFRLGWHVSFHKIESWGNSKSVGADLPLAICRAAIKAKGIVEVPNDD